MLPCTQATSFVGQILLNRGFQLEKAAKAAGTNYRARKVTSQTAWMQLRPPRRTLRLSRTGEMPSSLEDPPEGATVELRVGAASSGTSAPIPAEGPRAPPVQPEDSEEETGALPLLHGRGSPLASS